MVSAGLAFTLFLGAFSGFVAGLAFNSFRDMYGFSDAPARALHRMFFGEDPARAVLSEIGVAVLLGVVYSVLYYVLASTSVFMPVLSHTTITLAVVYGIIVSYSGVRLLVAYTEFPGLEQDFQTEKMNWGFLYFVYGSVLGTVFHFTLYIVALS